VSQAERDQAVVLAVDQRLLDAAPDIKSSSSPIAASLRRRTQASTQAFDIASNGTKEHDTISHFDRRYQRIMSRLETIIARLDAVRNTLSLGFARVASQENVPISILASYEWVSLVRTCVSHLLFSMPGIKFY
jgi:hypothetical protein